MGSSLGLSTLAFLVIGLVRHVDPDWLPLAWILGGILALGVGWWLSRRSHPSQPETQVSEGWRATSFAAYHQSASGSGGRGVGHRARRNRRATAPQARMPRRRAAVR